MQPGGDSHAVFDSKGQRLSDDLANELSESMWSTIVEAFKYSDEHASTIDPQDQSIRLLRREAFEEVRRTLATLELALNEAKSWGPFVGDPIEMAISEVLLS